jgi:hypothetical protein
MNNIARPKRGLTYDLLKVGMTVRVINRSSPRYLQEGIVLSIEDEFCGGYDLRIRMETSEIIGGIDPTDLDYE